MADNSPEQPQPPPPPSPPPAGDNNQDPSGYWCYQCDKRVPVETLPDHPEIICFECKNGFVESISVHVSNEDAPAFGNEFVQVLRLIAQAAREDDEPPPPPSDHPAGDNDYHRIELDGWDNGDYAVIDEEDQEYRDEISARWYNDDDNNNNNNDDNNDDDDDDDDDDEDDDDEDDDEQEEQIESRIEEQIESRIEEQIENRIEEQIENRIEEQIENRNDEQIENRIGEEDEHDGEFDRRDRHDVLRLRLREVSGAGAGYAGRRSRILDWAEMLMGLEDQSIEFRLQLTGHDDDDDDDDEDDDDEYIGNPGDYVDAARYESLLQTLAESDVSGRRGAPPAAKSTVENLQTVEIKSTDVEMCAVCKDKLLNDEGKVAKRLECGHMYHEECIIPWLGSRNTCPVCRYELPTDDPEYEEDRKRRSITIAAAMIDRGCSSSSGGD